MKYKSITFWAANYETPDGQQHFFSFFFFLGIIGRKQISS
jgi:hypothetical protein